MWIPRHTNIPRTRAGGITSVDHISRTIVKSSCFAAGKPRYASIGIPAQPGALLSFQFFLRNVSVVVVVSCYRGIGTRGTIVMLQKKGSKYNFGNYRAIGLMCHSYKLLSMLVLHRMQDAVESRLAETQAGFRRERGCRDNVLLLRMLMDAVLRAGKQAVVTFIDYRAAFNTISHRFLDESLTAAGVQPKILRIVTANRDGASALNERRYDVFGAISRQKRRHPGRHLQSAVFYARIRPIFQAARHRWPGH